MTRTCLAYDRLETTDVEQLTQALSPRPGPPAPGVGSLRAAPAPPPGVPVLVVGPAAGGARLQAVRGVRAGQAASLGGEGKRGDAVQPTLNTPKLHLSQQSLGWGGFPQNDATHPAYLHFSKQFS